MRLDRCFERPVSEILQAQIDAGAQVLAVMRRANARDVFDRAPEAILEDPLGTRLTCEPVIERELETFLTFIVDIRKADQVPVTSDAG